MELSPLVLTLAAIALLLLGMSWGWLLARTQTAAAGAERDVARGEAEGLRRELDAALDARELDRQAAAELAPLRDSLERVERQVRTLERDRVEQFGQVGEHLAQVAQQTRALQQQTAALSGALSSSGTRGTWGEVQLRRVLEHAGMLEQCDFDEQVSGISRHDARVRPDVVVRLPGAKTLVIDSKAPLTAFLRAQADDLAPEEVTRLLREHARALRGHVETLAAKDYWSAFTASPELVICFVPSDAVLAAALRAEPDLYDRAQARRVVLASPATLLAVLRATALAWQQEALTSNAQELLRLGAELHQRLGTVGRHLGAMGTALRRSVETYNQLVGTLESRVLVTARRMQELGLADQALDPSEPVQAAPRPLTSPELLAEELAHELTQATPQRALEDPLPAPGASEEARAQQPRRLA
ncbi:DNA recombination protein RmuC [Ornithinimicrobium pratense]|uniref:DNA recombination protein RmuC n=1 Tax=Ornithinimicrobium pratense TaxID=2593973 RepID=A0A5J6V6R2_9MICO|nr:DNA recombination protein RmuC [Ornithinimicrobium pratense]QFG69277.1 DNA recombination protein RmuC [Ornithinimicrobium pratense]